MMLWYICWLGIIWKLFVWLPGPACRPQWASAPCKLALLYFYVMVLCEGATDSFDWSLLMPC